MQYLRINGGKKLGGNISLHGAKNSILPILAASLLIKGKVIIHNCPNLSDVRATLGILEYLGASVDFEYDTITIDTSDIVRCDIPEFMMKEMRSSIIFLGSISSRLGKAEMYLPGGCEIGLRPIDMHLAALKSLGYEINFDGENIVCHKNRVKGTKIVLPFPSVGATENIILASCLIDGTTQIVNAAREPEIEDLIEFLNKAGAKIRGQGTPVIIIDGVKRLKSVEHTIIPDRILATTFMSASVITKSKLQIDDVNINHLSPVIPIFDQIGCEIRVSSNSLLITPPLAISEIKNIETMPYPGFPTDCQAPVMACLTLANGTSIINEKIFESRYKHVSQLNRFGADISIHDKVAVIKGVKELHPTNAVCTDLRGGASVVLCALAAVGESNIKDIYHIDRGYENIENQFSSLGADIRRLNDEKEGQEKS